MLRRALSSLLVVLTAASWSACGDSDPQVAHGDLSQATDAASDAVAPQDASPPDANPASEEVTPSDAPEADAPAVDPPGPVGLAITGRLYDDREDLARSAHAHAPGSLSGPLPGLTVRLASPGEAAGDISWRTTTTDADGRFFFDGLAPGLHLVLPEGPAGSRCTSNNLSRRMAAALDRGSMTILTFGDSVPHWGPTPWFPARLATLLAPLIPVTDINLARPGSTSREWLPSGGRYFETLTPHLAAAEVIVFSLGGNDLTEALSDVLGADPQDIFANLDTYLARVEAEIDAVEANLRAIIAAITAQNGDADLVWFVYPNYAWNDHWSPFLGDYAELARALLAERLEDIRFRMSRVDGLLLADMYGALAGPDVAPLMVDELHLNEAGHARYAREVLSLLGGVEVGDDASSAYELARAWGFHPGGAPTAP
jgi:lysophospholipase L1-like esterase